MRMITAAEVFSRLPQREARHHKGSYGSVAAVAGSLAYRGRPRSACEGALRGGAGLVYLASVEPVVQLVLARTPECCALPCRTDADGGILAADAAAVRQRFTEKPAVLLAGPGLGVSAGAALQALLGPGAPWRGAVLDADALNAIAAGELGQTPFLPACTVLTPHPGEMARLLGTTVDAVQARPPRAVQRCAQRFGCAGGAQGRGHAGGRAGRAACAEHDRQPRPGPRRQRRCAGRAAGRAAGAGPDGVRRGAVRGVAARRGGRPLRQTHQPHDHAAARYPGRPGALLGEQGR